MYFIKMKTSAFQNNTIKIMKNKQLTRRKYMQNMYLIKNCTQEYGQNI